MLVFHASSRIPSHFSLEIKNIKITLLVNSRTIISMNSITLISWMINHNRLRESPFHFSGSFTLSSASFFIFRWFSGFGCLTRMKLSTKEVGNVSIDFLFNTRRIWSWPTRFFRRTETNEERNESHTKTRAWVLIVSPITHDTIAFNMNKNTATACATSANSMQNDSNGKFMIGRNETPILTLSILFSVSRFVLLLFRKLLC